MQSVSRTIGGLECEVFPAEQQRAGTPILLGLHGRGSSPERLFSVAAQLGQQFLHVLPQGPLRVDDGAAWYSRTAQKADEQRSSRDALLRLLSALREELGTGPEKTAVWGFSQGGCMGLDVGLFAPSALAAAISIGGKLSEDAQSPEGLARARRRDFFLVHGTKDEVVPIEASRQAYRALNAAGARLELAELPIAHEITPVVVAAVRGFLASCVGEAAPPTKEAEA